MVFGIGILPFSLKLLYFHLNNDTKAVPVGVHRLHILRGDYFASGIVVWVNK